MLNLPTPKFNGIEISANVSLAFLPGVRTIDIHGELKDGAEATESQFAYYMSLSQADFPNSTDLNDRAFEYFRETASVIDVSDFGLVDVDRSNICDHYEIQRIVVPPLWETEDRYLILGGNCNWNPEHGIQFIVENSTVIKCGESDGIYQGLEWKSLLARSL